MGQTCSTHLLLCLDADLERDAMLTIYKDAVTKAKGSQNCKWLSCYSWTNGAAENMDYIKGVLAVNLPVALDHESKLTIMCHASSTSFGNKDITPLNLARLVQAILQKQKIKRVSILGCQAGGKKTFRGFEVSPEKSAAFEFASRAGRIATTVTARTGRTFTSSSLVRIGGKPHHYEDIMQKVSGLHGRHQGREDKVVFTPNPNSSTADPKPPAWAFETYGKWN